MRYVSLTAVSAVFAVALTAGLAQATQIVNEDDTSYTLTIITPAGENAIEVGAGVVLEGICLEGCTVVLGENGEIVAKADDTITIENGKIGLDE